MKMNSRRRKRQEECSPNNTFAEKSIDAPDHRKRWISRRRMRNGILCGILSLMTWCSLFALSTMTHKATTANETSPNNTVDELTLRRDWTSFTKLSRLAQGYKEVQSNCQTGAPVPNPFSVMGVGLGSELHSWTQQLCGAYAQNKRVKSRVHKGEWTWLDQQACNRTEAREISPLHCYFPLAEGPCTNTQPLAKRHSFGTCDRLKEAYNLTTADMRQAGIEFLFSTVSPIVVEEAKRQARLVFGGKPIPKNLITVHVRWGDKVTSREMKYVPIEEYINAVATLAAKRKPNDKQNVSVYLATEDPKAVQQFREKAPSDWNIYIDQYFYEVKAYRQVDKELWNQNVVTSKEMKGRAGLLTLASLLVAMEANDFVLTTASNWSRLMNELRMAILDVECNQCTNMIDLQGPSPNLQV